MTVRLQPGLPSLRCARSLRVLNRAIEEAAAAPDFRIVHGSMQTNHLHFLVEARDSRALASGMCGVLTRLARGWNRSWTRRGAVFADRYHARILRTPIEVRRALVYVLQNVRKHGGRDTGVDPYSSGPWFDGWREPSDAQRLEIVRGRASPYADARTWLLHTGWRRHGRIGLDEFPIANSRRRKNAAASPRARNGAKSS